MHQSTGYPVHLIFTFLLNFLYFKPNELKCRMSISAYVRKKHCHSLSQKLYKNYILALLLMEDHKNRGLSDPVFEIKYLV